MVCWKFSLCAQVREKLSARDVLHQKVKISRVLRKSFQSHLHSQLLVSLPRTDDRCLRGWCSPRSHGQPVEAWWCLPSLTASSRSTLHFFCFSPTRPYRMNLPTRYQCYPTRLTPPIKGLHPHLPVPIGKKHRYMRPLPASTKSGCSFRQRSVA